MIATKQSYGPQFQIEVAEVRVEIIKCNPPPTYYIEGWDKLQTYGADAINLVKEGAIEKGP